MWNPTSTMPTNFTTESDTEIDMFKKECATLEEAQEFVKPLLDERKWVIGVQQLVKDGPYHVQWQEHKMYTAMDGREFRDEIWKTEDGRLILVQDLEVEHCRNVLRMLLRQEREQAEVVEMLKRKLGDAISGGEFDDIFGDGEPGDDDDDLSTFQVPGSTTLQ